MLRPEIYTYLFLFLIFLAGCTGGSKKQESDLSQKSVVMDSSYLFDGKTLNRWKITNFGPQGPVYVSGGNIVLEMVVQGLHTLTLFRNIITRSPLRQDAWPVMIFFAG